MKSQKTQIDRLTRDVYADLTPEERLSLVLMHQAERNPEEAIRLVDTCPLKRYRMMDPAFTDGFRAAYGLAMSAATGMLAKYMLILQSVLSFGAQIAVCCLMYPSDNAGECEVKPDPDLPPPSAECALAMKRMLKAEATMKERGALEGITDYLETVFGMMKAEWAGFNACCRDDARVDGRVLLQAFVNPSLWRWFEAIEPDLEQIELPEGYEEIVEASRSHYSKIVTLFSTREGD